MWKSLPAKSVAWLVMYVLDEGIPAHLTAKGQEVMPFQFLNSRSQRFGFARGGSPSFSGPAARNRVYGFVS
jgi:hypothetical protein